MQNLDEIHTKIKFGILTIFRRFLAIFLDFRGQFFFFCTFSNFEFLFYHFEIIRGCFIPWCLGNHPIFEDLNDFSKFCGILKKKIFVPTKIHEKQRSGGRKMPLTWSKMFFSTRNWVIPSVIHIRTMPEKISQIEKSAVEILHTENVFLLKNANWDNGQNVKI